MATRDDFHDHFQDHFSEHASAYVSFRPVYPSALVDFLADLAPARHLAWDAGCGSGQFTVPLAARFERVLGTDASVKQLEQATRAPGIEYRQAIAATSGLPEGAVDLATAAQAAHWFDLDPYYAEVRRVTRPESVLALVTYGLMSVDPEIDRVIRHLHSERLRSYWPAEREHVEKQYRTLPFPFDEVKTPHFEIRMEWTLSNVLGYVETWSGVRALEAAEGADALEGVRSELMKIWHPAQETRTVRWPVGLRVGRVGRAGRIARATRGARTSP